MHDIRYINMELNRDKFYGILSNIDLNAVSPDIRLLSLSQISIHYHLSTNIPIVLNVY